MSKKVILSVLACVIMLAICCSEKSTTPSNSFNDDFSQKVHKFTNANGPIGFEVIKKGYGNQDIPELSEDAREIASLVNQFAFDLFTSVVDDNPDSNVFFSPLSISMALGMQLNGADGNTRTDMLSSMHLTGLEAEQINQGFRNLMGYINTHDPEIELSTVNSIWLNNGVVIKRDFVSRNQYFFDASVANVDFQSAGTVDLINQWISSYTGGKITDVLDMIPAEAFMYLVNAIYMDAPWTVPFDTLKTTQRVFSMSDGAQIPCHFMIDYRGISFVDADIFEAVELQYGNGDFSMVLILPREDLQINDVVGLVGSEWEFRSDSFQKTNLHIAVPKFRFTYDIDLEPVLTSLGMSVIFDPINANFTGITDDPGVYVSRALHKAYVGVSESGTEATAATVIETSFTGEPPEPDVNFNRPFLFLIKEAHSGLILFMGKVVNPVVDEM